jgi:3-deoxy-manno-octulosonate cytidylyltransferase (CMP-KDO synthetase)
MSTIAIMIPARLKSGRFPSKPLTLIQGKPMILHVIDRCVEADLSIPILVLTDSIEIQSVVINYGFECLLTADQPTGTDRIAEANSILKFEYVINIQGDEPVFNPLDIRKSAEFLLKNDFAAITGYTKLTEEQEFYDSNTVKVVFGPQSKLIYISRAPIPGSKFGMFSTAHRQVCVYGYSRKTLEEFYGLEQSSNELAEDHELLRLIDNGYNVGCLELSDRSIPVDIPSDVQLVEIALTRGA